MLPLLLALALTACSGGSARQPAAIDDFFDNYKTVVASADKDGYTAYRLGREFTAGGLVFRGPYVSGLPDVNPDGGGVEMRYVADTSANGLEGPVTLELAVYSAAAWDKARNRQDGAATKFVRLAGQDAKLFLVSAGTRPVDQARLLLAFGDTTVLAIASSGGPATPGGSDANPLIDETTLISVMQNLRAYPQ